MKKKQSGVRTAPILSIVVPAYNVESYLTDCLSTLLDSLNNNLEVIIVNDGSKDGTLAVANRFAKKHKHMTVISKDNGGHGSTINAALRIAKGRYFKVVDGDDMVDERSLFELIGRLQNTDSDIILTDYTEYYMETDRHLPITNYRQMTPGKTYQLNSKTVTERIFSYRGPLLSTTTFKTDLYRNNPFFITEHCYYVDMEYNFFIYQRARTVEYLPINLYIYRLEREGQSMQRSALAKNYKDHERVTLRLTKALHEAINLSEAKFSYLLNTIVLPLCRHQYRILIDFKKSRRLFLEFDAKLQQYPTVYDSPTVSGTIIRIHRLSRGVTIMGNLVLVKAGEILRRFEKK